MTAPSSAQSEKQFEAALSRVRAGLESADHAAAGIVSKLPADELFCLLTRRQFWRS